MDRVADNVYQMHDAHKIYKNGSPWYDAAMAAGHGCHMCCDAWVMGGHDMRWLGG